MGWMIVMVVAAGVCWYGYSKGWFDGLMGGDDSGSAA